jgi:MraZ protein
LLGGAVDIELDGSGRVLIPEGLKNFATLGTRVVVVGVNNRVELWNEDMWNAYTARVESQAESLAEKLTTIGMM